jgi:hypothetical protein
MVQIKGQILFKGEIITSNAKMMWGHLEISITTSPKKLIFT